MTRWLSTPDGDLDQGKLKTLVTVAIAIAGAASLIAGTLYQTFSHGEAETSGLLYMASICVAPLTAGALGLGIGTATGKVQSRAIQEGAAPGRRASDRVETPPEGVAG